MSAADDADTGSRRDADAGSRRELLRASGAAVAAGAAAVLEACGGSSPKIQLRKLPTAARRADIEILQQALDLEYRAIAAYTASFPLLHSFEARAAKRFLQQELDHAAQVWGLIKNAGVKPPEQPAGYDFGQPRGRHEVLTLLHDVESKQLAHYVHTIPQLTPGPVRAIVASILGNDAQHVSVLRAALGRDPVPSPFVTGHE